MIPSTELIDICQQLLRDSGGKKVMVVSVEGEVLAHAGGVGCLDEPGDALAQLLAEVLEAAAGGRVPAPKDLVAALPELPKGLSACATAVGAAAALLVVFDGRVTALERVRLKVRRAREVLNKNLPLEPSAEKPSSH